MLKEEIYNFCKQELKNADVRIDEPMKKHTSFKIGGNADIFIKISDLDTLNNLLKYVKENNINLTVIGNGSNILVKDNGIRGIVLKLDFKDININRVEYKLKNKVQNKVENKVQNKVENKVQNKVENKVQNKVENKVKDKAEVSVGAGVPIALLAQKLLNESISGFEFASGIPGTIGGAVRMNAGAYGGEFKDIVIETKCIDENGEIKILKNQDQNFSYRHSIFSEQNLYIIETKLLLNIEKSNEEILKKMEEYAVARKAKQPIGLPNAGSTFKRGEDFITAQLIDQCGLKGYSIGDAQISEVHAGFIVNKGNATADDVLKLVDYVKKEVMKKFNKEIKLEIEILGE